MASEENRAIVPYIPLPPSQQPLRFGTKKRGRPRKYVRRVYDVLRRTEPISAEPNQITPPTHSTQDNWNIQQHEMHSDHSTSDGGLESTVLVIQALPALRPQDTRSKRSQNFASQDKRSVNQGVDASRVPVGGDSGKDDIIGKHFVAQVIKKCAGFSLIMVKVNNNQMLKGWIPDVNNHQPVTAKNDLPLEPPMVQPRKVRKRASAVQSQPPIPPKDVTFALPIQMRGPLEEPTAAASSSEPVNPQGPPSAAVVNPGFAEPSDMGTNTTMYGVSLLMPLIVVWPSNFKSSRRLNIIVKTPNAIDCGVTLDF